MANDNLVKIYLHNLICSSIFILIISYYHFWIISSRSSKTFLAEVIPFKAAGKPA